MSYRNVLFRAVSCLLPCLLACSEESPSSEGGGAATGGSAGLAASGGSAGTTSGTGGSGAVAGSATGGVSGSATGGVSGSATGGSSGATTGGGGAGGTAGDAGAGPGGAGTGGSAGMSGSGGATGGMSGSGGKGGTGGGGSGGGGAFTLTSPALTNMANCGPMAMASNCARFPNENISFMNSMNISPELNWTGAPAGTMSFAVVLQDLSNGFAHWVIWNIPASTTMLPANVDKSDATPPVPAGSQQCNNGTGDGYFGPGSECNVYEFIVYALSMPTFSPTSATMATNVRMQLQGLGNQILGTASLRGRSNFNMTCNP